eukprot:6396840-Prymnesium_polylepis.1
MVVPGRSRVRALAVRTRGAAGEQSAHGAESPGKQCLVAAPNAGAAMADNACMPPPPAEDAVLRRK